MAGEAGATAVAGWISPRGGGEQVIFTVELICSRSRLIPFCFSSRARTRP